MLASGKSLGKKWSRQKSNSKSETGPDHPLALQMTT
jgi:hypothetical protein